MGFATSKMGEITTSALHHWTFAHIRDSRTHIVLTQLRISHTYLIHKDTC
ncbi:hypothetical protein E2C01_047033 [Portunus trituberculatus]|uniref:Uncharacterized protein n=1 Tax=Portunus trituberculatus TaxID=210409 RepID=A0A5B7G7Q0_PORTR|nr:hypothetical protein [Portunus trituberculatus]